MKKKELEKLLAKNGWYLKRQGSNHEVWTNGIKSIAVPRHRELNEKLARGIIKDLGLQ